MDRSDLLPNNPGNEMTYRICYDDGLVTAARDREAISVPNSKRSGGRVSCSRTAITTASSCMTMPAASSPVFLPQLKLGA